jgi:hypothetical protein
MAKPSRCRVRNMIVIKDSQWTTIQCDNDKCELCHKVLNNKHMRAVLCPYCGTTIMLSEGSAPKVEGLGNLEAINNIAQVVDIYKNSPPAELKRYPKVKEEDTVGHELKEKDALDTYNKNQKCQ